jgi:hypothetical protein
MNGGQLTKDVNTHSVSHGKRQESISTSIVLSESFALSFSVPFLRN